LARKANIFNVFIVGFERSSSFLERKILNNVLLFFVGDIIEKVLIV
jgi:hypothetical protein